MKKCYKKPAMYAIIKKQDFIVMSGEWINDPYGEDWWNNGGFSL